MILGIDPGLNVTGYGLIEPAVSAIAPAPRKVCCSSAKQSLPERLAELYDGLVEVLDGFKPGLMGLEKLYSHYNHPVTAITMAHARGVLVLAAQQRGIRIQPLPSTKIKKIVTGNGRASKEQVNGMVKHLLGIPGEIRPLDVSDALAAAIAAMEMEREP